MSMCLCIITLFNDARCSPEPSLRVTRNSMYRIPFDRSYYMYHVTKSDYICICEIVGLFPSFLFVFDSFIIAATTLVNTVQSHKFCQPYGDRSDILNRLTSDVAYCTVTSHWHKPPSGLEQPPLLGSVTTITYLRTLRTPP
jgi:hypothetical protein